MRTNSSSPIKPRHPGLAALLGGVCIGAGLFYVGRKKTAAACIVLALLLVGIWSHYHILWTLWLMAVLWNWQIWHGYDKAEDFNTSLEVEGKPPW
jgi:hypothetical protein